MRIFNIFKIRREELIPTSVATIIFATLNILFVNKFYNYFTPITSAIRIYRRMLHYFDVSGYDPITLITLSSWCDGYNVFRHPLLAFLVYPLYLLNMLCQQLFGINCALFIAAVLMTVTALYSFVFIRRIFKDVLNLNSFDSNLLSAFFFSMGYVMVITFVPDHFAWSMLMLLIVLYVSGTRMAKKKIIPTWQMAILYVFTTGVTTTNSIKMVLAQLFVNRRKFFTIKNILFAIIIPSICLWMFCQFEYKEYVYPAAKARYDAKMKKMAEQKKKNVDKKTATFTAKKPSAQKKVKKVKKEKKGKPLMNGAFMGWTDITTSRVETVKDNLFGESIQLHRKHLLGDVLRERPIFVKYDNILNDIIEGVICVLFVVGIWFGRKNKLLWLALSWFACDIGLHVILGFGINEIYIMSPHWLFVIPVAIAFIFKDINNKTRHSVLRSIMLFLTVFLWLYNGELLLEYLLKC